MFNCLSGVSQLSIDVVSRPGVNGSGGLSKTGLEAVDCDRDSISSSGSFHSTLESLEDTHVSICTCMIDTVFIASVQYLHICNYDVTRI